VLSKENGLEPAGIYDDNPERGQQAAERYGTTWFNSLEALIENGAEGLIICSENSKHHDHCITACKAGVHVLCEKPIATRLSDAREMIAAADAANVVLKIAFTTRFTRAAQELRAVVRADDIGDIVSLAGMNRGQNPGGWFVDPEVAGGGSMMDHIVHQLDFARWLSGLEPRRVYAEQDTFFGDIPSEDAGLVLVEFDGGVPLTIDASWSRPPQFPTWGDNIVEINGARRSLYVDTQAARVTKIADGPRTAVYVPYGNTVSGDMIMDFVRAAGGQPSIGATGEDGYAALEVALAAYQSVRTGRSISLPLE
jgi:predicted dehydrogenase